MHRFSPLGFLFLRLIAGGFRVADGFSVLFQEGEGSKLADSFAQAQFPASSALAWGGGFAGFLGGILLIIGLGTRVVAVVLLLWVGALVALLYTLTPDADPTTLLLQIGILLSLFFIGGGSLSVDNFIGLAGEEVD